MSTKTDIPVEVIPDIREALLCRLGDAAETVATEVARRKRELHPEWVAPGRDLFERVCALLDLIGWDGTLRSQSTQVAPGEHAATLMDALKSYLPLVEMELEEVEVNDARRAKADEPPRRESIERRVVALREFATVVKRTWTSP